ncbi:MAG: hypothetical protein ACOX0Z_02835 [Candidatus Nanosyncoccaceae bacterium]
MIKRVLVIKKATMHEAPIFTSYIFGFLLFVMMIAIISSKSK